MLLPSSCSNLLAEAVKRINSLVERRVQDLLDTFMNANTFELMESFVPKSLPMLGLVAVGDLVGTISTLAPTNPCKFSLAILMKAGELQVSMVRRILSLTVGPVFNTLPSRSWIANKDEDWSKQDEAIASNAVRRSSLHSFVLSLPLVWLPVGYMLVTVVVGTGVFLIFFGLSVFILYLSLLPPALFLICVFLVNSLKSWSHLKEVLV